MANEFTFLTGVEQGSAPATPDTGDWRFYFKSDGFYILDDAGTEVGPFGSFGASGAVELLVDNETGGTLTAGTPVYVSGYNVGADLLEVSAADATDDTTMPCIGLVKADISDASTGTVVVAGLLNDLDTSSFTQADLLYVSETAGELTATAPTGSAIVQQVAEVVRDNVSTGALLVQLEQTSKTGFIGTLLDDGDAATARATLGAAFEDFDVDDNAAVTTDTIIVGEERIYQNYTDASLVTVTIDTNANEAFTAGEWVGIRAAGAAGVEVAGATGVTINGVAGTTTAVTLAQYDEAVLVYLGSDVWAAFTGGGAASPLTTKGDLYTYDTADARLAVGADGQVLTADAAEATGMKWAAAAGGGGSGTAKAGAAMARTSNLAITATTDTDVTFTEELWQHGDVTSNFSTGEFTVENPGLYLLSCVLFFTTGTTDLRVEYKLNGTIQDQWVARGDPSSNHAVEGAIMLDLAAGDDIILSVYDGAGGNDLRGTIESWASLVKVAGGGGAASPEGFRAYASTNQTLSANTWTTIEFDTEDFDQSGDYNNTTDTWTCPTTGWYMVSGSIAFDGTGVTDGDLHNARVTVNGTDSYKLLTVSSGQALDSPTIAGSIPLYLSAGDTVVIEGNRESAGDTIGNTINTYFSIVSLGSTDVANLVEYSDTIQTLTYGATVTPDPAAGMWCQITLTGNVTFDLTNLTAGQTLVLDITQDGTGSRTVSFTQTVLTPGGAGFTASTAANAIDRITVDYDGTNYFVNVVGQAYA